MKISEYEQERNLMLLDLKGHKLSDEVSEEDFAALATLNNVLGVEHEARKQWLKDNGYRATRKNMLDSNLTSKVV